MTANWNYIGHVVVGTIVTTCQAVALAGPSPAVVSMCHIISLVAMNLGVSFGVWQVSQLMTVRRDFALMAPKPALPQPPPLPVKVEPEPAPMPVPVKKF